MMQESLKSKFGDGPLEVLVRWNCAILNFLVYQFRESFLPCSATTFDVLGVLRSLCYVL